MPIYNPDFKMEDSEDNATSDVENNSSGEIDDNSLPDDDDSLPDDDAYSEEDEEGSSSFQKNPASASKKRKFEENEDDKDVGTKSHKKKKKKSTVNVKPPTAEEMSRLRETENLFHSNLFRLQIEEMIKEVKPKKLERKSLKQWLDKLIKVLAGVDDIPELTAADIGGFKVPIKKLPKETDTVLNFLTPVSIDVRGSYKASCCLGPSLSVDVFVTAPKNCFLKTDYINARYLYKRALYLTQLAKCLDGNELLNEENGLEFCTTRDPMKPCLLLHPAGNLSKVEVFVHVVVEPERFKFGKFLPEKCNLKTSWWTKGKEEDKVIPTPLYNNSIVEDLVISTNEELRFEVLSTNPNLKEAIVLLRVWLRQRELDKGYGSFSGYLASMFVVYLFRNRKLNTFMSSYQIVRNVWLALSQSDWTQKGISLSSTTDPSLEAFHKHFEVVFLDITGYCNLTAQMSSITYNQVKEEAILAIQCLDNPHMNSFHALFMTPMPFLRQYDHVIRIDNSKSIVKVSLNSSLASQLDCLGDSSLLAGKTITQLFERAMGHRLSLISVKRNPPKCWKVTDKCVTSVDSIMIGLRLNAEFGLSVIDKGPPANLPEAANFRELWGTKSELRRFKDGNVCEAVVWADAGVSIANRRLIVKDITLYLLTEKLGLNSTDVVYLADQLEPLLYEANFIPDGFDYGTGEEAARRVIDAYDALAKQLRAMTDLPLDISSIQGVSPVFRFCDVFPPLANDLPPVKDTTVNAQNTCMVFKSKVFKAPIYTAPVEVVVQLGLSRKWPEDIEAVRRIRAAFNIQIAKNLSSQCNLQAQAFPDYVDVGKDGFVFRVRVAYAREVVLLKEITTPDGKTMYRDSPQSIELEKSTVSLPKLSGALYGLSQQCPGYGPATCLAKRWLHSQMFNSSLFPDIATELLMAYLFVSPEPFRALIQPQVGFLRFLHLLTTTNWFLEPIIVSFNSDLKREDILEIEAHFRNERSSLPPLFIATQFDKTGSLWTKQAPITPVLVWLTKVATEALKTLESHFLTSGSPEDCKQIFRPPMHTYDALIILRAYMSPLSSYGIDHNCNEPTQVKVPDSKQPIPIVGFDPVQKYLTELRENYGEFALFFHNTYGGNTIGVIFRPSVFEKREVKVSHLHCSKTVTEGGDSMLSVNIDALVDDFYWIGKDLVMNIQLKMKQKTK